VVLGVLYFILIVKRRPLLALVVLLAIPALVFTENVFRIHSVSTLLQTTGENIVVEFKSPQSVRELVFAAHYDSKTDVWDHIQRAKILALFPFSLILGLLLCLWTFLTKKFQRLRKKGFTVATVLVAASFVVYTGYVFSWLGGYVFLSNESSSPGAIDDGAGVVVLLGLAKDIKDGKVDMGNSDVTIVLTGGEEIGRQGAFAYVEERYGDDSGGVGRPTYLVNLELIGQNGNLIYWENVGSLGVSFPADPKLIRRLDGVWQGLTGKSMEARKTITDDSQAFAEVGIPFVTIGHSGLPGRGLGGFHWITDNMERVNPENLHLGVRTLEKYIESYSDSE
ncbi:MAG: Zn-dependent exopeptidase M28, partial [Proteobacteria bacterium]|nr:Zn-dependent exopeptidase M28 [Pseudomonadota bacterium]